jgi:hypothetical protein
MDQAFLQYGALGAITLVCLVAIRVMYQGFQRNYERERARADRLEEELSQLNETVRTEYLRTLADATRAIADALSAVRRAG